MPIEIRELVIRTHVTDEPGAKRTQAKDMKINEKEIIERCVEKILRRLNKKAER